MGDPWFRNNYGMNVRNIMSETKAVELKACPFCGGDKIIRCHDDGLFWKRCRSCGATGPETSKYDGEEGDPFFDWNTRAKDTATLRADHLKALEAVAAVLGDEDLDLEENEKAMQDSSLDAGPSMDANTEAKTVETSDIGRNLAAYTPPGSNYPPFISINYRNTMVEITVRSPAQEDGSCGSLAKITMNLFHFHKLIDEAKASLK